MFYQYNKYKDMLNEYATQEDELASQQAQLETQPLDFFRKHADSDLAAGDAEEERGEKSLGRRYRPTRAEVEDEEGNLLYHINKRVES